MGTEVLRPQDCLIERIRVPQPALFSRRRNYGYPNPNYYNGNNYYNTRPNRKPAVRHEKPDQRRQRAQSEPSMSKRSSYDDFKTMKRSGSDDLRTVRSIDSNNNLVMGKVTILRRGESLDSKIKSGGAAAPGKKNGESLMVNDGVRPGPAPEMVRRQMRIVDINSTTTGKSDVYAGSAFAVSPAPSSLPLPSFSKKKQISIDDSATRDIKRLLRLD